jgi:hypothetical protein
MATSRYSMRVLATLTLWAGFGLTASAQLPALTVEKALETKTRQPGVPVTTPAPDQVGKCKVDPIPNPKKPGSNMGYVVRDAQGRPVRQFVSYDEKQFNIVAFYVDGLEAYREVYPPNPAEPYQFRWLGPNGGKWGLDKDRDGRVDEWVVLSPEEASQELLQAVLARDPKRLDALLPTKENLDALGLPPAEAARIKDKAAGAPKRLADAAAALKLSPEAKWVHVELAAPQTTPSDSFGGRDDLVVHKTGTILIQDGKETKFLQTGELVQVGRAWKLVEGPTAGPGGGDPVAGGAGGGPVITPEIAKLVEQLDEIDKNAPNPPTPEKMGEYYAKRVGVLEQVVQKLPPKDQGDWAKLLVDSLTAAAELGKADAPAHQRLKQLKDTFVAAGPGNPLGAYASYRVLVAEYRMSQKDATGPQLQAAQDKWRTGLEAFAKAHPAADDTGEAVLQLAMSYEFAGGKDGEAKAKEWYGYLTQKYPQHPHAAKAAGSIKRLDCEGKPFDLHGTILTTGQPFTPQQVAGKVVVVFYWATWSTTLSEDAKKVKDLVTAYGPKGLEVVTVCLDDDAKAAQQAVQSLQLPGTHLHMKGGADSPLATAYGIHVPPHVLVVAKDGKVMNRNAQIATLEDDVKRLAR